LLKFVSTGPISTTKPTVKQCGIDTESKPIGQPWLLSLVETQGLVVIAWNYAESGMTFPLMSK
jgi:hypothetical protein